MLKEKPTFIVPLTIEFPMDGEEVKVTAADVETLGAMLEAIQPVVPELQQLPREMLDRMFGTTLGGEKLAGGPTAEDLAVLLRLVSAHRGVPKRLVALGVGWPEEKVGKLLPDRFAWLFSVVVQVNADFFDRALPGMLAAAGNLQALKPQMTSGSNSSTS